MSNASMRARVKRNRKRSAHKSLKQPLKEPVKKSTLLAPVKGAERRVIGHVRLDVGRAGAGRVKRMVYPPGFHWARDMKSVVGTTDNAPAGAEN